MINSPRLLKIQSHWQNWTIFETFFVQVFVHPAEGGPGIELLRRRGGRQPEEEVEKGEKSLS